MEELLAKLKKLGFDAVEDNGNVTIRLVESYRWADYYAAQWAKQLATDGIQLLSEKIFDYDATVLRSLDAEMKGKVTISVADAEKLAAFSKTQLEDFHADCGCDATRDALFAKRVRESMPKRKVPCDELGPLTDPPSVRFRILAERIDLAGAVNSK